MSETECGGDTFTGTSEGNPWLFESQARLGRFLGLTCAGFASLTRLIESSATMREAGTSPNNSVKSDLCCGTRGSNGTQFARVNGAAGSHLYDRRVREHRCQAV